MPKLPVPELVKIMNERRLATSGTSLNLTTVYRLFHSHNLMAKQQPAAVYRHKFEAEYLAAKPYASMFPPSTLAKTLAVLPAER